MIKQYIVIIVFFLMSINVFAAEGFKNESELGTAIVSGNTNSETYNAKQMNEYIWNLNVTKFNARYLSTKTGGTESARSWDGSIRYERVLSDTLNIFAAYSLESDIFSGYVQRNSADLGAKYFFTKSEPTQWFAELGYRYFSTHYPASLPDTHNNGIRAYSEVSQKLTANSAFKFWIEYVASLTTSNPNVTAAQDYLLNAEPSLSVMLNEIFSMKSAYLFKYRSALPQGSTTTKYLDSIFTTALVAKF
jgi:putative salt-induced outer membrane protein